MLGEKSINAHLCWPQNWQKLTNRAFLDYPNLKACFCWLLLGPRFACFVVMAPPPRQVSWFLSPAPGLHISPPSRSSVHAMRSPHIQCCQCKSIAYSNTPYVLWNHLQFFVIIRHQVLWTFSSSHVRSVERHSPQVSVGRHHCSLWAPKWLRRPDGPALDHSVCILVRRFSKLALRFLYLIFGRSLL